MVKQSVNQGTVGRSVRRMDDESLRLVYDDHIGILVDNIEGYILRLCLNLGRKTQGNGNILACLKLSRGPDGFPVCENISVFDELLDSRAGEPGLSLRAPGVDPLSGAVFINLQNDSLRFVVEVLRQIIYNIWRQFEASLSLSFQSTRRSRPCPSFVPTARHRHGYGRSFSEREASSDSRLPF